MAEKLKKVIRRKPKKSLKEKEKENKTGRPSLEDTEPTNEMIQFAYMVGMGVDPIYAQKQVGFSSYQRREYLKLPQIKAIIESAKKARGYDSIQRAIDGWDRISHKAILELEKRIMLGELSEQSVMKIAGTALAQAGCASFDGRTIDKKPKQITSNNKEEEVDLEDDEKKESEDEEYKSPYSDDDIEDAEYEEGE